MSTTLAITLVAAAGCYGLASVLRVELSNGRRVTGVAAFGPAIVALGPAAYDVAPVWALLASALAAQALAMGVRRSGWGQFVGTSVLLVLSGGVFVLLAHLAGGGSFSASTPGALLAATLAATVPYAAADLTVRSRGPRSEGIVRGELRWGVPLYLVLGSTAGLVVLAFDPLGWIAFPLLLLALVVTWHEFQRFAEARRTYEQTVRAMGRLTERAGYAPNGYHQRVSSLAGRVGRELGLSWEDVRALRLVGQVHRVGAVSLSAPDELDVVGSSSVERSGRRILEETGYLAPYAGFLAPIDSRPEPQAEILRGVSQFVQLERSISDPVAYMRAQGDVRDEVLEALAKCLQADSV